MPNNWPTATTGEEYFRSLERRMERQERRGAPISASSLLGPGMSSQAVRLIDWNDEMATFNGFFYTYAGAFNAPEVFVWEYDEDTGMPIGDPEPVGPLDWSGMVVAREDGTGSQHVWNTDEPEMMFSRVRNFWPNPDDPTAPRVFGEWMQWATPTGFIEGDDLAPEVQDGINNAFQTAEEALAAAEEAIGLIPPANWVFYQATAPVSDVDHTLIVGDFWFDTDDGNRMWTYDGTDWVDPADAIISGGATAAQAAAYQAQHALEQAEDAITLASSASQTFYQTTEPTGGTYTLGATWYDTDDNNKQYRWNGAAWVATITGWLQTNSAANRGVKVTTAGLLGYADGSVSGVPAGTVTFSINGTDGSVTILGALTSGSTVTGATVTGGIVQTSATPNVGLKMTSAGLVAYNDGSVPGLAVGAASVTLGSNGVLTTAGAILAGGQITGSSITASTGGVIQTESTASRGIKMNSSGLLAYANGSGSYAAGTLTFSLLATTGEVAMLGGLVSGATISGGVVQTATSSGGYRAVMETLSGSGRFSVYNGASALGGMAGGSFLSTDSLFVYGPGGIGNGALALRAGTVDVIGDLQMNANDIQGAYLISAVGFVSLGGMTASGIISSSTEVHSNNGFIDDSLVGGSITYAYINNNGKIYRGPVPSSARFKRDITPLDFDEDAVLGMQEVEFYYRDQEEHGPGLQMGLIAEQVAEVGMERFVHYDADGVIQGVNYPMLVLALLNVLRKQRRTLDNHEDRLAALETRS